MFAFKCSLVLKTFFIETFTDLKAESMQDIILAFILISCPSAKHSSIVRLHMFVYRTLKIGTLLSFPALRQTGNVEDLLLLCLQEDLQLKMTKIWVGSNPFQSTHTIYCDSGCHRIFVKHCWPYTVCFLYQYNGWMEKSWIQHLEKHFQ